MGNAPLADRRKRNAILRNACGAPGSVSVAPALRACPSAASAVCYDGYGPQESYPDKRQASFWGRHTGRALSMHTDYIKPQESGSHCGCTRVCVDGFEAIFGQPSSFSVSPYSAAQLSQTAHCDELRPENRLWLHLDYKMSGVGSASCGPALDEEWKLNENIFDWRFALAIQTSEKETSYETEIQH